MMRTYLLLFSVIQSKYMTSIIQRYIMRQRGSSSQVISHGKQMRFEFILETVKGWCLWISVGMALYKVGATEGKVRASSFFSLIFGTNRRSWSVYQRDLADL